jgi:hypothetical protein
MRLLGEMEAYMKDTRDPNCPARDLTKWFGWAFTCDKHARLVGQHNAAY